MEIKDNHNNDQNSEKPKEEPIQKLSGLPSYKSAIVIFLFILIFNIFIPSVRESHWPYLIMTVTYIFFQYFNQKEGIRSRKTVLLAVLMFTSLFGMQFIYYIVLPIHGNYQPITDPRYFAGFQMEGKFYVDYFPDYPEPGSTMLLYVSICDVGLVNCKKCTDCAADGYIYGENNRQLQLFQNLSFDEHGKAEFPYPGKYVEVDVRYADYPKNFEFVVPQQSFWYTVYIGFLKNPILAFLAGVSTVLALIGVFYGLFSQSKKFIESRKGEGY